MIRIDMLQLLRVAQARHHEAEKRLPPHDWTVWYAAFRRQVAGYSIGWGFEADYLDSLSRLDCLRLRAWLEHNAT